MTETAPRLSSFYVFPTTTHVIWAEEVALEKGIQVEIVPAPPGLKKVCGLAIRTWAGRAADLETLLEDEGIPFQKG